MDFDEQTCEQARLNRDARFDGRIFIAITSTGIYCRPICPSPHAKRTHVRFFPSAAAASAAGFRPCLRCRPEVAPGTPAWNGTSTTVSRGLRLIAEGALDESGVETLAARLGVSSRHLARLFQRHLGALPTAAPRAVLPRIRLEGPKIERPLTTSWYARRVNGRFERCVRGS